jgi:hypothetical protein
MKAASIIFEVTQKPGVYNLSTSFRHIACPDLFTSEMEATDCLCTYMMAQNRPEHSRSFTRVIK